MAQDWIKVYGGYKRGPGSIQFSSVQFSSVPWLIGSLRDHEERFSRDPLPVFSAEGLCEQFWHGQGCPLFDVVHPAFPLSTTASPILQGSLKDGFGESVVACDMHEPCKFRTSWLTWREINQSIVSVKTLPGNAVGRSVSVAWYRQSYFMPAAYAETEKEKTIDIILDWWLGKQLHLPTLEMQINICEI